MLLLYAKWAYVIIGFPLGKTSSPAPRNAVRRATPGTLAEGGGHRGMEGNALRLHDRAGGRDGGALGLHPDNQEVRACPRARGIPRTYPDHVISELVNRLD